MTVFTRLNKTCLIFTALFIFGMVAMSAKANESMELWYDVLDLQENKIGYYFYKIDQPDQQDITRIDAKIFFKIKKFFITFYKYEYQDTVYFNGEKLESYHIEENDNGTKTVVDAETTGSNISITISRESAKFNFSIAESDYDASMFHFRFPASVDIVKSFDQRQSNILIPLEGKVKQYHYSTTNEENVTWDGKPTKVVKLFSKTDDDQTQSWINDKGITIYLKTKTYILSLTTQEQALAN